MTLKLNGETDGSVSIDAPADTSPSGTDITLTLPTSAGSAEQFLKNSGTAGELEFSSMVETSTGVGIGNTAPDATLRVTESAVDEAAQTNDIAVFERNDNGYLKIYSPNNKTGGVAFGDPDDNFIGAVSYDHTDNALEFYVNNAERARIDSEGRLLVNHTSDTAPDGFESKIQTVGTDYRGGSLSIRQDGSNSSGPSLVLTKSRSSSVGGNTIVQDGDNLGSVWFYGADGNDTNQAAARVFAEVDDTPGSNDMPGRLVFATTSNSTASPSERMRITNVGYLKASNNASYVDAGAATHELNSSNLSEVLQLRATSSSYNGTVNSLFAVRSATSSYWFIRGVSSSGGAGADNEFYIRGDGRAFADESWNGGGADYAEYFEWSDGNTGAEDRRGISVVLDGDKIREAVAGEEPIGVISGHPSVVGDSDMDRWKGKYLRDDYGSYILDEDGYRQLNPDFDSSVEYVQREDRPEWDTVGLMGKLRIRKGQVTGTRWIKMRDVSDTVEEWLVR